MGFLLIINNKNLTQHLVRELKLNIDLPVVTKDDNLTSFF